MTAGVGAAVTVDRTLGIKLLETLLVSGDSAVTPDLLALQVQSWTHSVETMPGVVRTWIAVLLVNVRRALTSVTRAHFR